MPVTLSILVVSFNEAKALPLQAAALDALDVPPDVEIERILIDGGSTDGTQAKAVELGYRVIEIAGGSIPVCRNRALKEASGAWLAFLDADCAPCTEWLKEARPFLENDAPAMLGWPVVSPPNGTWVQQCWHAHWANKNPVTETHRDRQVIRHEAFRLMATRNMLLNKEVAELLNGFDEGLPTGEDTDFALRAYQRDIHVMAVETLVVTHYGEPATLKAFFRQQLWHANRSAYLRILKESGGKTGGNAPLFTILFLISAILVIPLPFLLGALALRTSLKAGQLHLLPGLFMLYGAYGLARSMDLLGLGRKKISWKL